jgi:hypothetical protein
MRQDVFREGYWNILYVKGPDDICNTPVHDIIPHICPKGLEGLTDLP